MSQKERLSSLGRLSTVIAHEVRNPLMIIKAALHTLRQPDASRRRGARGGRRHRRRGRAAEPDRQRRARLRAADSVRARAASTSTRSAASRRRPPQADARRRRCALDLDPSLPLDHDRRRAAAAGAGQSDRECAAGGRGRSRSPPRRRHRGSCARPTRSGVDTADRRAGRIVVADTGDGIDRRDLPRVFDPYFTTKRGGTGLGLPIAKNIVEGLGGTIAVASAPGRGTEIRIELPARHVRPASPEQPDRDA